MFGQIEPLSAGTKIIAREDGDKFGNKYEYEIQDCVAQGGSGIVYKAINTVNKELVILKEYYPYNDIAIDAFYRRGGVIVSSDNDDRPYLSDYLEKNMLQANLQTSSW